MDDAIITWYESVVRTWVEIWARDQGITAFNVATQIGTACQRIKHD